MEGEASERPFQDSEHGDGLLEYLPLRFNTTLQFETYYTNASRNVWEPLPIESEAKMANLRLRLRNSNGTFSSLSMPPFALAFDKIVHPRTPAPENRCHREHSGYWHEHQCHVASKLSKVCVQVQPEEDGSWSFRHGSTDSQATFGCDGKRAWHPATYVTDSCWGVNPRSSCTSQDERHVVQVVVRSMADPWIRAEELTDNSFDFGLSPETMRVYGFTLLMLGLFFSIPPTIVACEWMYRRRRRSEENVPLDGARGGFHDEADCRMAGIYGHRRV
jgi:hypothetical protein